LTFLSESFFPYTDQMNERELLQRAQSGDFEAFTELVDAHKAKVYALVYRMAGNREDAEDIFQETLFKAIDKIDQFRGDSSFGTWLYSIALNQARALHAKSKQAELMPLEEYLPGKGDSGAHGSLSPRLFDWKNPETMLESEELNSIIDVAISELPLKYREAFVLRYIEELPVKEVAAMIGQSEAATKSRILRARLALRDRLSGVFEESYG
jgi:RNA polymerase sigma-70 factor (ECF subfamily)